MADSAPDIPPEDNTPVLTKEQVEGQRKDTEVIGDRPSQTGATSIPSAEQAEHQQRIAPPPEDSQIEIATWAELSRLPVAPPQKARFGGQVAIYACPQHPNMTVFYDDNNETAKFDKGYLLTDNEKLIETLEHASMSRYVRRVTLDSSPGG